MFTYTLLWKNPLFFCWINKRHPSVQPSPLRRRDVIPVTHGVTQNIIIILEAIVDECFCYSHTSVRCHFIVCLPLRSFSFDRWRRMRQYNVLNADDVAGAVVRRILTTDSNRTVFALNCMWRRCHRWRRRQRRRYHYSFHSIYHYLWPMNLAWCVRESERAEKNQRENCQFNLKFCFQHFATLYLSPCGASERSIKLKTNEKTDIDLHNWFDGQKHFSIHAFALDSLYVVVLNARCIEMPRDCCCCCCRSTVTPMAFKTFFHEWILI